MKSFILAAGVAALAIAAPAAAGDPKGGGKGQSAKIERGGGKQVRSEARGGKSQQARTERRSSVRMASNDRGPRARSEARAEKRQAVRSERRELRSANRAERRELRSANRPDKREMKALNRADKREMKAANRVIRDRGREGELVRVRDRDINRGVLVQNGQWSNPGVGCPPGLAKQNAYCMPPGQLNKSGLGQLLPVAYRDKVLPLGLRDLYRDTDDHYYRYGDGYVYRVDRDTRLVSSLLPLLGAGLGLGQAFPTSYMNSYVPDYYRSFYPETQDDYFRYANGYVYEIDRDSGMIEGMIPLMNSGYGVGQMLPLGYSAYNVPYQYRDMYYDRPDAYYRYAPGAIYQVDPKTQLITAVASLLAPNSFNVGQPLPMGYSSYNVPLAYRDQYYDTPDSWYRYNNGSIYRVDPTTQLITAVISALV